MSNAKTGAVVAVVVIVAIAAAVILGNGSKKNTSPAGSSNTSSQSASSSGSSATKAVATDTVTIKDYAFTPAAITVKVGTTVTWTNQDTVEHSVVSNTISADAPNGPLFAQGASYKFTFNKAGTYTLHCSAHPYMHEIVQVTN